MIEDEAVAIVPAPKDLPRLLSEPPPTIRSSALLAGDIDYGRTLDPGDANVSVFDRLTETGAEVAAIARLAVRVSPPVDVVMKMGQEATKDTFLSEAVGRRHLHLATHGFFRAGRFC